MKKYLVLLIPLLFLMAQCHKTPTPDPEPDLPPATQEGKGTIGCYINGKPWWPKPYFVVGGDSYLKVAFNPFDNRFYLQSIKYTKANGDESLMSLTVKKLTLGDNVIDTIRKVGGGWSLFQDYTVKDINKCSVFEIDTMNERRLTITRLDTNTTRLNVVSGTFEFTAYNKCGDILKFTKGRFDTTF